MTVWLSKMTIHLRVQQKKKSHQYVHVLFLCVFLHVQVADFNVFMDQIYICWNILDIDYIEDFIFKLIILI